MVTLQFELLKVVQEEWKGETHEGLIAASK